MPVALVAAVAVFVLNVTFVFTGDGVQFLRERMAMKNVGIYCLTGMMSQMELSECRR